MNTGKLYVFIFTSLLIGSFSIAMPVDRRLGRNCPSAGDDVGLNKTENELIHLASIISANGKDPRTTQDRSGKGNQFAPIGALRFSDKTVVDGKDVWNANTKTRAQGTAFLVSPCLILTEAHVVYGEDIWPKHPEDAVMTFEAGERGAVNHEVAIARPFLSGRRSSVADPRNDWALMKLDKGADGKCMGERLGWLNTDLTDVSKIPEFTSAGFPIDRPDAKLIAQKGCKLARDIGHARTECAGLPGNSGGPIMVVPKQGAPNVVAMMSTTMDTSSKVHKTMNDNNVNKATQIVSFIDDVIGDIAVDRYNKINALDIPAAAGAK